MVRRSSVYQRFIRRYADAPCPARPNYIHDVSVALGLDEFEPGTMPTVWTDGTLKPEMLAIPGWPEKCACGYVFQETDSKQYGHHRMFEDDQGRRFQLGKAPTGAMWHADWLADWKDHNLRGEPLGPLCVQLPDGFHWNIDGPANNAPAGWTRTGTPPLITVTGSIKSPRYHGFLTNGVLTDDVDRPAS